MAGGTADTLCDMDRMIEVDVAGKLVDALPTDRPVFGQACPHRRQHLGIGPNLGMAGHAGFGRRQPRKTRFLDRGVTVAAIESQAADMMFMTEGHGLIAGDVLLCDRANRRSDMPVRPQGPESRQGKPAAAWQSYWPGTEDLHTSVFSSCQRNGTIRLGCAPERICWPASSISRRDATTQ